MLKLYPNELKSEEFDKTNLRGPNRLGIVSEPPEVLEDLLLTAGEEENAPPEPIEGIPRQRLPCWIRWPLRVFFLPFILLDLWAQRLARLIIRPPFKQTGTCKKRGNCCHYILIPATR